MMTLRIPYRMIHARMLLLAQYITDNSITGDLFSTAYHIFIAWGADRNMEFVRKILGEPYYSSSSCMIYNMDCTVAMESLSKHAPKEGLIDLTITSPPYNIGKMLKPDNSKRAVKERNMRNACP